MFSTRGSPVNVAEMYFDSLRAQDRERAGQLSGNDMRRITSEILSAYTMRIDGIAFGEMFYNPERDLSIKTGRTTRDGSYNASVEVEIRNLNAEKFFTAVQLQIMDDIKSGRGNEALQTLLNEKDLTLVGEVYRTYYEAQESSGREYISEKLTLNFYRNNTWHLIGSDDNARLKNVLLGGFGEGFTEALLIDWEEVLGLKENPDEIPWDSSTW
jgi:hypothetical protein